MRDLYSLSLYLSSWTHRVSSYWAAVFSMLLGVQSLGYPLFGAVSYVLWAGVHARPEQAVWLHDIWTLVVFFALTSGYICGMAFAASLARSVWAGFLFLSFCFLGFVWKP